MNLIFAFILVALAFPVGFWIAWLARDELISGRKWFRILIITGIAILIVFLSAREYAATGTGVVISIISGIAYWKSYDRKWTKKWRCQKSECKV